MRIRTDKKNAALAALISDPELEVLLDANFFIPPDRSFLEGYGKIDFENFVSHWLEPVFSEFPALAIHESVYDELVQSNIRSFADSKINHQPCFLRLYKDSDLTQTEQMIRNTYLNKIAQHSKYIPGRDNSDDRGEIRSLSFMAAKRMIYFAANDGLPVRLVEMADILHTGLDDMSILQSYHVLFYLYHTGKYDNKKLKMLYKYQYFATEKERTTNPSWSEFTQKMDALYF